MSVKRLLLGTMALVLVAAARAGAQTAEPIRVAVCNPAKVFEQMDERKVIQDKLSAERERQRAEAQRRRAEIDQLAQQVRDLKPGSPLYDEKSQLALQKTVEFDVWARLTEATMLRQEREQIIALYEKVREACKEVAVARKLDLVIAEHRPEIPQNRDNLTREQLNAILAQNDVLFSNDRADITAEVVRVLNAKYNAGGAGAGAGAGAGGAGTPPATPPR